MFQKVNTYELSARFDSRKNFYGKAFVEFWNDKRKEEQRLLSYGTHVATIITKYKDDAGFDSETRAIVYGMYSSTTLRHIKEFLKQNDFKAESKNQILEDYGA